MNTKSKKVLLTGLVAAAAAIIGEHLLTPTVKKRLKI